MLKRVTDGTRCLAGLCGRAGVCLGKGLLRAPRGARRDHGGVAPLGGGRRTRGRGRIRRRDHRGGEAQADPVRRLPRPHHRLLRRLHIEPAHVAGGRRASPGRCLRLRPLLLGPRLLVHHRPRRGPDGAQLAGDAGVDAPVQPGRGGSGESGHGGLRGLGVDAGRNHAGGSLRAQERDPGSYRGRTRPGPADCGAEHPGAPASRDAPAFPRAWACSPCWAGTGAITTSPPSPRSAAVSRTASRAFPSATCPWTAWRARGLPASCSRSSTSGATMRS